MLNDVILILAFMLSFSTAALGSDCEDGRDCLPKTEGAAVILDGVQVQGDSGYTSEDIVELFDIKLGVPITLIEASAIIQNISQKLRATGQFDVRQVSLGKSLVFPHYMITVEVLRRDSSYVGADFYLYKTDWFGRPGYDPNSDDHEDGYVTTGSIFWGTRHLAKSNLALDVDGKIFSSQHHYSGRGVSELSEFSFKSKSNRSGGALGFTLINPSHQERLGYVGAFGHVQAVRSKFHYDQSIEDQKWTSLSSRARQASGGFLIGKRWKYFQADARLTRSVYNSSVNVESSDSWQLINFIEDPVYFRSSFELMLGFSQKSGLLLVEPGARTSLKFDCALECFYPMLAFGGEYTLFLTDQLAVTPLYAEDRGFQEWPSKSEELGGRFDVILSPSSVWYLEFTRIRSTIKSVDLRQMRNHLEVGTKYARPDFQLSLSFIVGSPRLFDERGEFEGVQRSLKRLGGS